MAFLPSIPQATDALSTSQGDILNNFTILGAIAGNNNPSSASINPTAGFNWIYLPSQGAIPPTGSAFTANNVALYSATDPNTGKNELYINKQDQATTVQVPATSSTLSVTSNPGALSQGFSYLPSGIIMQWGNLDGAAANPFLVTFPLAFPTAVLSVVLTPYAPSFPTTAGTLVAGVLTNANFRVGSSLPGVGKFQYIALGY